MDQKKLDLIQNLVEEAGKKKQEEILPFFLAVTTKATELGITFTDDETTEILEALKPRMSTSDIHKIDMIKNFSKMMSQKS
jgi:hypothetical protein